jgi:hypothetical protein
MRPFTTVYLAYYTISQLLVWNYLFTHILVKFLA